MAEEAAGRWPELSLLFAIPNGARVRPSVALKLKAEGLKRGVPDMLLPVARGGYHGLFIELKDDEKPSRVSPEQREWLRQLAAQGYAAYVCKGADEAWGALMGYLVGEVGGGGA